MSDSASTVFRHVDAAATVVFGRGAVDRAADLIGDRYVLLTTARAAAAVPSVVERAAAVVQVPSGQVDVVAAQVREQVAAVVGDSSALGTIRLVALGGGRVIDVAKALAAAERLDGPVAIPTSLSGAEMTGIHRHARGVDESTARVRAAVVVNDPDLSASQPVADLAASSANALGHAITALVSSRTTPIAAAVAAEAIGHLARGWVGGATGAAGAAVAGDAGGGQGAAVAGDVLDRESIALGALLAGWAVDRSALGPHHALAQSAVRTADLAHAPTNAALLPRTARVFAQRVPSRFAALDASLPIGIVALADLLFERAGSPGLGVLATDSTLLERVIDVAAGRPELRRISPAVTVDELRAILLAAA